MSDIAYLPPPGPLPIEGAVAPDHNREPPDVYETPAVDNNAVSGVVIDQNATPVAERGPQPEPKKKEGEVEEPPYDGDPLENPDLINHPASAYEDPDLSFYEPETMKAPDDAPEDVPTFPPGWVAEGEGQGEVPAPPE